MKPGMSAEEEQRQVEGVAEGDEARRLVGRVDLDRAGADRGLVGDDADRAAVEAGEADDDLRAPSAP